MKICIVGLGYVGLPAACVLAQPGHTVVGVDVRSDVAEGLNKGQNHIDAQGLHDLQQDLGLPLPLCYFVLRWPPARSCLRGRRRLAAHYFIE